jgi:hypothetical protein
MLLYVIEYFVEDDVGERLRVNGLQASPPI